MKEKELEKSLMLLQNMVNYPNHIEDLIKNSTKIDVDNTNLIVEKFVNEFLSLTKDYGKEHTIEQWLNLIDYVGVDPLLFIEGTRQKFHLNLQDKSIDDIKYFINFAQEQLPNKKYLYAFDVIEDISFNSAIALLAIWSDEETLDIEKFSYFWINEHSFLHSRILRSESLHWLDHKPELTNLELLERMCQREKEHYKFGPYYIGKSEMQAIMKFGSYLDLQEGLNNSGKTRKKTKI